MKGKSKSLIGIAGAYFVAAELTQLGYIATVTSRNTEGIDILASNLNGSKSASIQVKTSDFVHRESFSRSWHMAKKQETIFSSKLFYVFVDLNPGDKKPDFYIVPSKIVADYIRISHKKWLNTLGRKGQKHNDTDMRTYEINDDKIAKKFHNKWKNLKLD